MMVLIQKFDELEKASDNLRKTGYYDKWPSDYYEGTVLKRQSYRRYRNGRPKRKKFPDLSGDGKNYVQRYFNWTWCNSKRKKKLKRKGGKQWHIKIKMKKGGMAKKKAMKKENGRWNEKTCHEERWRHDAKTYDEARYDVAHDVMSKRPGLYANILAKKRRIKAGSKEKMRKRSQGRANCS